MHEQPAYASMFLPTRSGGAAGLWGLFVAVAIFFMQAIYRP